MRFIGCAAAFYVGLCCFAVASKGDQPVRAKATAPADTEGGQTVLETRSYWRSFAARGPAVIAADLISAATVEAYGKPARGRPT